VPNHSDIKAIWAKRSEANTKSYCRMTIAAFKQSKNRLYDQNHATMWNFSFQRPLATANV
jgi:hypothetical protein